MKPQNLKPILFLIFLTFLLLLIGVTLGGVRGMWTSLVVAVCLNGCLYAWSDKVVLKIYRAEPLFAKDAPELFEIVQDLAQKIGIPMPRLYLIPSASGHAFVTGRSRQHAALALTYGLVKNLNKEELQGLLAHEMAHILYGDHLSASMIATLAGGVGAVLFFSKQPFASGGSREPTRHQPFHLIILSFIMPLAAGIIQFSISKSREYRCDERSAFFCGNPLYLASALKKIERISKKFPLRMEHPPSAHLFIINPLEISKWKRLFNTHPPLEARIARLEKMARNQGL